MIWTDLARRVANDTAARPAAVARVRARLDASLQSAAPLLRDAFPAPSPLAAQRVREGLVRRRAARALRRPEWVLGALGAAMAAALLLVVVRPETARDVALSNGDVTLSPVVSVATAGAGQARGAGPDWQVDWQSGRIDVSVVPDAGARVSVVTREARVEVVGTAFSVDRDALGTSVDVAHGRVVVTCFADGRVYTLGGNEAAVCTPTTASGLLARASALAERGDAAGVQEALDAADALPQDPAVRAEVGFLRMSTLVSGGQLDQAAAIADDLLALPAHARTGEVLSIALHLALLREDCAQVKEYLADLGPGNDDLRSRADQCAGGGR